jgi:hypothetical protein
VVVGAKKAEEDGSVTDKIQPNINSRELLLLAFRNCPSRVAKAPRRSLGKRGTKSTHVFHT